MNTSHGGAAPDRLETRDPRADEVVHDALARSREARTSTWTTTYGMALIGSMLLASLVSALMQAMADRIPAGTASWVPAALAVLGLAAVLRGCVAIGLAHAEPDVARWLLPTPLRRSLILKNRLWVGRGLAMVAGVAVAFVVAVASHPGAVLWGRIGAGAVIGLTAGLAAHTAAAWAQRASLSCILERGTAAAGLVTSAIIALGLHEGASLTVSSALGWSAALGLALFSALLGATGLVRGNRWADGTPTRHLIEAGVGVRALTGAAMSFDGGALEARRASRRLAFRAWAPSQPSRGWVYLDLVVRDLRACVRRRREILSAAAAVLPAVVLGEVFGQSVGRVALALAAWCTAVRAGEGLTQWLGSSSLWRAFPQDSRAITACLTVAPLLLSCASVAVGTSCLGASWAFVPVCATAGVAGVARRAQRPEMRANLMVDSGAMGTLPLGIIMHVIHGLDLAAAVVAVSFASQRAALVCGALALLGTVLRNVPGR